MTVAGGDEQREVELWRAYDRLDHAYLIQDELAIARELSLIGTLQQGGLQVVDFEPFRRATAPAASLDNESAKVPSGSTASPDGTVLLHWRELMRQRDGRGQVLVTVVVTSSLDDDPGLVHLRAVSAQPGQPEGTLGEALDWFVAVEPGPSGHATGSIRVDDVGDWLQIAMVEPPPTAEGVVIDEEAVYRSVAAADAHGRQAWRGLFRSLPKRHPAAEVMRQALRQAADPQ